MISIIICSRNTDIPQELKDNIASSIGCEYELCVIDNSRNEYNIFSAYNEGVKRAKGDILCFMHEDVLFHSENFGKVLEQTYSQKDIGAVGIIGAQYMTEVSSTAWWESSPARGSIIQGQTDSNGIYTVHLDSDGKVDEITDVAVLDGCFITIRANLFKHIKWDDDTFISFHMYDMDICMQIIHEGYRVCVTPDILIEHKSIGTLNHPYYESLRTFKTKWQKQLPIYRGLTLNAKDIEWRENLLKTVELQQSQLSQIENSHAYRLGKKILKPIKFLKRLLSPTHLLAYICANGIEWVNLF